MQMYDNNFFEEQKIKANEELLEQNRKKTLEERKKERIQKNKNIIMISTLCFGIVIVLVFISIMAMFSIGEVKYENLNYNIFDKNTNVQVAQGEDLVSGKVYTMNMSFDLISSKIISSNADIQVILEGVNILTESQSYFNNISKDDFVEKNNELYLNKSFSITANKKETFDIGFDFFANIEMQVKITFSVNGSNPTQKIYQVTI